MVIAVIDGLLWMLQSWDMQVSGTATAAAWFLVAEPLQLAKPRFWRPPGSPWGKGRELQVQLASQQGGGHQLEGKTKSQGSSRRKPEN